MKFLLLALVTFCSLSAMANEFERRNAINEERDRERARIAREQDQADSESAYIRTIAASLCLSPSAIRGSYGDWTTVDGSIACGVANGGFAGPYIRCLAANGADVGGYYIEDGRTVLRSNCAKASKRR